MDEDDHVRDVYAFYGLAMYWAQCLEQSMFFHLTFHEFFPKNVKSFKDSSKWAADFDAYEENELGKTMGRLLQKLNDDGQLTEAASSLLTASLPKRNWLAHSYFSSRAYEFTLHAGRAQMIAELQEMTEMFRKASTELDNITMPMARRYGYTAEMEAKAKDELMAEMNRKQNS